MYKIPNAWNLSTVVLYLILFFVLGVSGLGFTHWQYYIVGVIAVALNVVGYHEGLRRG